MTSNSFTIGASNDLIANAGSLSTGTGFNDKSIKIKVFSSVSWIEVLSMQFQLSKTSNTVSHETEYVGEDEFQLLWKLMTVTYYMTECSEILVCRTWFSAYVCEIWGVTHICKRKVRARTSMPARCGIDNIRWDWLNVEYIQEITGVTWAIQEGTLHFYIWSAHFYTWKLVVHSHQNIVTMLGKCLDKTSPGIRISYFVLPIFNSLSQDVNYKFHYDIRSAADPTKAWLSGS